MVKVTFYNLLRSKYHLTEMEVKAGTIQQIIDQILEIYPQVNAKDFATAVVFFEGKPLHAYSFNREVKDGQSLIITHFVGGG